MKTNSKRELGEVIEWLQDMKERFIDPESVDDGEELAMEVIDKLPESLAALKRIQTRESSSPE